MRQLCSALLVVIITTTGLYAQPPGRGGGMRGEARERIHAAKIAYITDRLHLTAAQSGEFIPVYNDFEQDVRTIRKSYFAKYNRGKTEDSKTDDSKTEHGEMATCMRRIDDDLDYQQDIITLKRKYNDRFLKVISAQQLADLYTAEREFRQMLQRRLKEREMQR
jgi:hypothetical protein